MVCPGLHSIFSSFDAQFNDDLDCEDLLHFRCDDYDDRFGLFQISVRGCIKGRIKAFWRPSPSKGPNVFELAKIVPRDEFKGTKSLVIGGSRGLGSVTARILAAGGGNVVITYAMGFEQALEINDEINHWRQSASEMVKFDLTTDSFKSMSLPFDSLDSVYYFPTPRIFIKKAAIFDPKMFLEFSLFYVSKFYELCRHLEEVVEKPIQIFFPSSVFIEDRPHGVTEYAMAKSAAEVLIADVNKNFKKVYVTSVRLPRLNTDQTATMFKNIPTESNVEALLPIIRSLNSRIDRK
jgi:NAD(P)-dependent dehydrogenase (short-subunit alcohol dehydrogenase family)